MFHSVVLLLISLQFIQCYVEFQPRQIHLSLGENGRDIFVTWSTRDQIPDQKPSVVEYGIDNFNNRAIGSAKAFREPIGNTVQYIHTVQLQNLKPNTTYKYRCGGDRGWSPSFWFKTFPEGDNWQPNIALYGDLGNQMARGLPYLQRETQNGDYDAILHIGDFAYDMPDNNGKVGDEFMDQIMSIAAYVPYMTCPGNHEQNNNFTHYINRFKMPGNSDGHYYSFNMGPIHFIMFSSEIYYYDNYFNISHVEWQYNWLEQDLQEAIKPENRAKQPWIITLAHRPMYCTSDNTDDCRNEKTTRVRVGILHNGQRKFGLEKLFYKYGVDVEIWAHEHTYERYFPLYNYNAYNGSYQEPYVNPKAPVHLLTGSAGCKEGHDQFIWPQPEIIGYRSRDYSYSVMKAYNATHLYFEQRSVEEVPIRYDHDPVIIDSLWIIKDTHGLYPEISY